jgi:hypothetical protein
MFLPSFVGFAGTKKNERHGYASLSVWPKVQSGGYMIYVGKLVCPKEDSEGP